VQKKKLGAKKKIAFFHLVIFGNTKVIVESSKIQWNPLIKVKENYSNQQLKVSNVY
jgi:hypothetical protein